jgi:hypothetical protein
VPHVVLPVAAPVSSGGPVGRSAGTVASPGFVAPRSLSVCQVACSWPHGVTPVARRARRTHDSALHGNPINISSYGLIGNVRDVIGYGLPDARASRASAFAPGGRGGYR